LRDYIYDTPPNKKWDKETQVKASGCLEESAFIDFRNAKITNSISDVIGKYQSNISFDTKKMESLL
jgi:hypothetical protein